MTEEPLVDLKQAERQGRRAAFIVLAILGFALALGFFVILRLTGAELARETAAWQRQLMLMADSQAANVDNWLDNRRKLAADLAGNPSIRLYMSQKYSDEGITEDAAQRQYLQNLLTITAQRYDLDSEGGASGAGTIPANVAPRPSGGIALLDRDGAPLVSTSPALTPPGRLAPGLKDLAILGPATPADDNYLRLGAPVYGVQDDALSAAPLGQIYVALRLDRQLPRFFDRPSILRQAGRGRLIGPAGPAHYRDILTGEVAPADALSRWALAARGGYAELEDAAGAAYLAAAQPINGSDWVLLRQVKSADALGPVRSARLFRIVLLSAAMLAASAAVLLLWRHGVSVRVAQIAANERAAREKANRLARFLKLLSDGQPTAIMAFDPEDKLVFANREAARLGQVEAEDLRGKTLAAMLGQAAAAPFNRLIAMARSRNAPVAGAVETPLSDKLHKGRANVMPLPENLRSNEADLLLVWDDLSSLIEARDRREQGLEGLISVLAGLIDARDPYSAEQSRRVAMLGVQVARAREMGDSEVRTVRIAGTLMNLGKMMVPREILTKPGALSEAELHQVRRAMSDAVQLLKNVDFDAPVAETLEELPYEGRAAGGPASDPARLLFTVNAFVGMVSPRAHRAGLGPDQALDELRKKPETYAPATVAALAHVLHNQGWRAKIAAWQQGGPEPVEE